MSIFYNAETVLKGKLTSLPQIDATLSKQGFVADAKSVGDKIAEITKRLDTKDPGVASGVTYDNTESGLTSTSVQAAIDELNRPFSSYVGSGASQTVETNSNGRMLMVYNSTYLSLINPKGAIVVSLSNGEMYWLDSTKAFFVDGTLTIGTSRAEFNTSNETYYYQVM